MRVVAAGLPAELLTQRLQGVQDVAPIRAMAVIAQEEPVAGGSRHEPVTPKSICVQVLSYARMKRHQPLPVELGFPDTEDSGLEVDVGACEPERFGDAQAAGGEQAEDSPASRGPQTVLRRQAIGCIEQRDQLRLGVDVRNQAPVRWAEEPLRGNLRRRILAQAKACEPT